jgi:hypothetical protein
VPRRYTNHLVIDFVLSEVELSFGQRSDSGSAPDIHTRLVTTPVHLLIFGRTIQAMIARYQDRFGRIPDGSDPTGGDRRQ